MADGVTAASQLDVRLKIGRVDGVRRTLRRQRRGALPAEPATLADVNITGKWTETTAQNPQLNKLILIIWSIFDNGTTSADRVVTFSSPEELRHLATNDSSELRERTTSLSIGWERCRTHGNQNSPVEFERRSRIGMSSTPIGQHQPARTKNDGPTTTTSSTDTWCSVWYSELGSTLLEEIDGPQGTEFALGEWRWTARIHECCPTARRADDPEGPLQDTLFAAPTTKGQSIQSIRTS